MPIDGELSKSPLEPEFNKHSGLEPEAKLLLLCFEPALSCSQELQLSSANNLAGKLSNLSSVYANLLPELPAAVAGQIKDDFDKRPGQTALKLAESALIGAGTAVLLARSPVLARTLLAVGGVGAGYIAGKGAYEFNQVAFNAGSLREQQELAAGARDSLARLSADLIETAPAFAIGTGGGLLASRKVGSLAAISAGVRDSVELGARRLMPESFHYLGPGARTISGLGSQQELNLLKAGEEMMKATPWRGIEEGRFFRVSGKDSIKYSARLGGTESEIMMGRRSEQLFHTHKDKVLPTSGDFNSVYGTGVVGLPQKGILSFYQGSGQEARRVIELFKAGNNQEAGLALEALQARRFKTLVLEPGKELSAGVELKWNAASNRMEPVSIYTLDYESTVKTLSKWKGGLKLESIEKSAEALLKPGMTDLLRKISL